MIRKQITVVIGTRAQLIKVAPVLRELSRRHLGFRLVYTNQHRENVADLFSEFDLEVPGVSIGRLGGEKKTIARIFIWWFWMTLLIARRRRLIPTSQGIVLTHGDTLTTLWGALLGRMRGNRVMHIESGLRSFRLFDPFPEEIIRLLTTRLADVYACPNAWAAGNLKKHKGTVINTRENTLVDAIAYAISKESPPSDTPYVVVSMHRFENVYRKRNLRKCVQAVLLAADRFKVVFVLHPITKKRLLATRFYECLDRHDHVELIERLPFSAFIDLCKGAECVMTDGGSNQEELSFLGVPTLVLRRRSERPDGINRNVVISQFDPEMIGAFLKRCHDYRREPKAYDHSPSTVIADWLAENGYG